MGSEPNVYIVRQEACEGQRVRFARKLKIATWNFAGLCSERKQKEISEVLNRVKVDIVAGQETWLMGISGFVLIRIILEEREELAF